MFIKRFGYLLSFILIAVMPVLGQENPFEFVITNNKDLEEKLLFLEKLQSCTPYKYHATPSGLYEIFEKTETACIFKWTIADCIFPNGVYQEFSQVQRHRTIERAYRLSQGFRKEIKDREYRYLLDTGNKYCKIRY